MPTFPYGSDAFHSQIVTAGQNRPLEVGFSGVLNVDGSSVAVEREVTPTTGQLWWVTEVRLTIHSTGMRLDNDETQVFGAAGLLTNGLRLAVALGGTDSEVFSSNGVKNISEFFKYAASVTGITGGVSSPNTDFLVVRITFDQAIGLDPSTSDRIFLEVRDNLTSLATFTANARGWWEEV